jgi:hypothetical protein
MTCQHYMSAFINHGRRVAFNGGRGRVKSRCKSWLSEIRLEWGRRAAPLAAAARRPPAMAKRFKGHKAQLPLPFTRPQALQPSSAMFSFTLARSLSFLALVPLVAIPIYSRAIPGQASFTRPLIDPHLIPRQNGNPNAAGDLYGIGLRVGAYLQIAGMLLSCLGSERRSRSGIKLLSSSICLSLFTAWTILVANGALSPCEAWLVLSLTAAYGAPRHAAMNDSEKTNGGIAIMCCAVSVIWQEILFLWFFATLYRELPLLGTSNRIWFFTAVDVAGWFRVLMLVATCVNCLWLPFEMVAYLNLISRRFSYWVGLKLDKQDATSDGSLPRKFPTSWAAALEFIAVPLSNLCKLKYFQAVVEFQDNIYAWWIGIESSGPLSNDDERKLKTFFKWWRMFYSFWGFAVLVLTIAGVEKTIEYNSLAPPTDLSKPGQIIPFLLGIITLLEGVSTAFKPKRDEIPQNFEVFHMADFIGRSGESSIIDLTDRPQDENEVEVEQDK